jgi:hypothetical protein
MAATERWRMAGRPPLCGADLRSASGTSRSRCRKHRIGLFEGAGSRTEGPLHKNKPGTRGPKSRHGGRPDALIGLPEVGVYGDD